MIRTFHLVAYTDNPYNELLRKALESAGVHCELRPYNLPCGNPFKLLPQLAEYDVIHWHWPEVFYRHKNPIKFLARSELFLLLLRQLRRKGCVQVLTVHNLLPHERSSDRLHQMVIYRSMKSMDAILVHDEYGQELVEKKFSVRGRTTIVPHPMYSVHTDVTIDDNLAAELSIPQSMQIALCFGGIRRYKGLERVVVSANKLNQAGFCPVIAGARFDSSYELELQELNSGLCRFLVRSLESRELDALIQAAGVVLMPHGSALTSGAAHLVASHGRPMVTSGATAFSLFEQSGLSAKADFSSAESLTHAISKAREMENRTGWAEKVRTFQECRSLDRVGAQLADIYRSCIQCQ